MTASRLAVARYQIDHLRSRVLPVFGKAVARLPDAQLAFRPTPESMQARDLVVHVYQVVYIMMRSTETGVFRVQHLEDLPFDEEGITCTAELIEYGERVVGYLERIGPMLTDDQLARGVRDEPPMSGAELVSLAVEEATHHRGQLMVYLRLLGITPPFLYDYS